MTRRSKSSSRWLDEHFSDRFVKTCPGGRLAFTRLEPVRPPPRGPVGARGGHHPAPGGQPVELALEMCAEVLKPGGNALIKVFQGTGFQEFVSAARQRFGRARFLKPEASRARSPETYLLATGRRMV